MRFGITWTVKRRIMLDALRSSGHDGLTPVEIAGRIWPNKAHAIKRDGKEVHTVRSMRFQINEHFANSGSPLRVTTDRECFYLTGGMPFAY